MEERKRSIKPLIIGIVLCLIVCLSICGYEFYKTRKDNNNTVATTKPSLKDDFYEYVNYDILQKAEIPSDSGSWDKIYDAKKVIEERKKELTNEILSDPSYKNEEIDKWVELYEDLETRNKNGYSELDKYIKMIDDAKTIDEFTKVTYTLNRDTAVTVMLTITTDIDINDTSKNIVEFPQFGGDIVALKVYGDKQYARYKETFIDLRKTILKELGYNDEKINTVSKQIDEFNEYLYNKTIDFDKLEAEKQLEIYSKRYTLEDLTSELKNLPIKEFLQNYKVANEKGYIVLDMDQLKAMDDYYTEEHLSTLKEIAKIRVIQRFFSIPEKGEKYALEMSNKLAGTKQTLEKSREDNLLAIKSARINDEIQKRYEEKYFKEEDKKLIADLVEEIRGYYKEIIKNCDWLSDATKQEAITKLEKMKVNIGYQEKDKKDNDIVEAISKADGGTLVNNAIKVFRDAYDKFSDALKEEAEVEDMSTLEVNAGYKVIDNSINFLAGFKGLYENETDYYRILGILGDTIGHEISHAFDDKGSQFDENGKSRDWWTKEDRENYKKLTKKIEEYYSNYEFMGYKVNGQKTLGENIADLAALKAIVSIAEAKGATKEDYQHMFEAFAEVSAAKTNKETAESQILGDEHAPDKIRVNAVLSSIDKFYEVYDIKEGDGMYVAKEDRVGLW